MACVPETLVDLLAVRADAADSRADWPNESWAAVRQTGLLGWGVPADHGGQGLGPAILADRLVTLGSACATTAFILSQREAALRLLLRFSNSPVAGRYLPGLASGERFLTVGLSQLTTSRQHGAPSLLASV